MFSLTHFIQSCKLSKPPDDISLLFALCTKTGSISEVTLEISMAQIFVNSASNMWTLYQHCCSVKSYWLFLGQGQSMRISSPHLWTYKSQQYYSSGLSCRLETGYWIMRRQMMAWHPKKHKMTLGVIRLSPKVKQTKKKQCRENVHCSVLYKLYMWDIKF